MNKVNFLSLITAPVEVLSSAGKTLSRATSFFYIRDEKWLYLVTNWHVVTGRDPLSPLITNTGAVPTHLRLKLHKNIEDNKFSLSKKVECVVQINNETGNEPEWLEHPNHRFNLDIVVVKIPNDDEFKKKVKCHCLEECKDFQEDFSPSVMDDLYVIGYPWGLTGGDPVLPLYKKGSVASEPVVDYRGLPRFLIDCRTAEAMSGSPVLCAHSGIWAPRAIHKLTESDLDSHLR
jgi:hypothetical protein